MNFLAKLLRRSPTLGDDDAKAAFLHPIDRMRILLERERVRADRGNTYFSLLTFNLPTNFDRPQLVRLGELLERRLRITDDAGFLGPGRVGVILPDTPAEGAWKVADDVSALWPEGTNNPQFDVYVYGLDDEQNALPNDRQREPQAAENAQGEPAVEEVACSAAGDLVSRPAQAMRDLFVRPMPRWKRAIDVVGAATALVLASPVLLLSAVAIKMFSPGPVFFTQRRSGLGGREFTMFKFRTMCVDAEARQAALRQQSEQDGPAFKMTHDPRVTRLGRLLRKTSIDELPQLYNVLRGDMSLVGPRPLPVHESERCQLWQQRRMDVTPGLTCIWQIRGRSSVSFDNWARMDVRYIQSRSPLADLKLIAETVPAIVLGRGAV